MGQQFNSAFAHAMRFAAMEQGLLRKESCVSKSAVAPGTLNTFKAFLKALDDMPNLFRTGVQKVRETTTGKSGAKLAIDRIIKTAPAEGAAAIPPTSMKISGAPAGSAVKPELQSIPRSTMRIGGQVPAVAPASSGFLAKNKGKLGVLAASVPAGYTAHKGTEAAGDAYLQSSHGGASASAPTPKEKKDFKQNVVDTSNTYKGGDKSGEWGKLALPATAIAAAGVLAILAMQTSKQTEDIGD